LSETVSDIDTGNSIACGNGAGTQPTSYYRVFPLTMFGITGAFEIANVHFVVEHGANGPTLEVSVGTYSGTTGGSTLVSSAITLVDSVSMTVNGSNASEDVPIQAEIPAGGSLLVEIDQTNSGSGSDAPEFYIGANSAGETAPGYMSASACSITVPTSVTQQAGTETDILISVDGSAQ
jgi:hypothetical protein